VSYDVRDTIIALAALFGWFALACVMLEVYLLNAKINQIVKIVRSLDPGADL
jgi:hypothetical protein